LGGIWGQVVKKDYLYWLFAGFLCTVIIITNPFTSEPNGITIDILSKYQQFDQDINFNQLSEIQRRDLAEEYVYMARQLVKHDKYNEAVEAINKALKLNPAHQNIYSDLGSAYLARAFYENENNIEKVTNSNDYKLAKEFYQKNINEYPESPVSFEGLIYLHETTHNYEMAIETAHIGCFENPNLKNRCKKVADLYLLQGDRQKAIDFYKKLTTLVTNSDTSWIYNKIGYIYHAQGNCKQAKHYFKNAYKTNPTSANLDALMQTCYNNSLDNYMIPNNK
jgi:tetratricopeptide (TPR) repeat protein